jgi:hypothetical protein
MVVEVTVDPEGPMEDRMRIGGVNGVLKSNGACINAKSSDHRTSFSKRGGITSITIDPVAA